MQVQGTKNSQDTPEKEEICQTDEAIAINRTLMRKLKNKPIE